MSIEQLDQALAVIIISAGFISALLAVSGAYILWEMITGGEDESRCI